MVTKKNKGLSLPRGGFRSATEHQSYLLRATQYNPVFKRWLGKQIVAVHQETSSRNWKWYYRSKRFVTIRKLGRLRARASDTSLCSVVVYSGPCSWNELYDRCPVPAFNSCGYYLFFSYTGSGSSDRIGILSFMRCMRLDSVGIGSWGRERRVVVAYTSALHSIRTTLISLEQQFTRNFHRPSFRCAKWTQS